MKMIKNKLFSDEPVEIGPESGIDNYIMAVESIRKSLQAVMSPIMMLNTQTM